MSDQTVLVKCGSHRARAKMLALVGRDHAEALFSMRRDTGKGVYRIPAEHERAAKAITGVSGFRDGDDLMRCWPSAPIRELLAPAPAFTVTREIPLLDPSSRAGRTGYRLKVKDAKNYRSEARSLLGNSRDDVPTVEDLLRTASYVSRMLYDATEGEAKLSVNFKADGSHHHPSLVLGTFR